MNSPSRQCRLHFAENMIRLGLYHIRREALQGGCFVRSLNQRSPIFRLTALWDGRTLPGSAEFDLINPDWLEIVNDLEQIFESHKDDAGGFESKGLARLWPLAEPRIDRDLAAWPWTPEGYATYRIPGEQMFGCFIYEFGARADTAVFHICNACLPDSPFKDIGARKRELLAMIEHAARKQSDALFIRCNSWLNSLPPFLALFPPEYPRPDRIAKLGIGYNWWGQFMRRDGGFHTKNGERFRCDGGFPYAAIDGICSLASLKQHLEGC